MQPHCRTFFVCLLVLAGCAAEQSADCPKRCSESGVCFKKQCFCTPWAKGPDCNTHNEEYQENRKIFPNAPWNQSHADSLSKGKRQYPPLLSSLPKKLPVDKSSLRVCIVTCEFIGPTRNGGIAVANTALAHSLVEQGHRVTVLYTRSIYSEDREFSHWIEYYTQRSIELIPLSPSREVSYEEKIWTMARHFEVYVFLEKEHFDIIHFHEYEGWGYYPTQAKKRGLAFKATLLTVITHGNTAWAKWANQEKLENPEYDAIFKERKSVLMADLVISPSNYLLNWMTSHHYDLPSPSNDGTTAQGVHLGAFVQPNLMPKTARRSAFPDISKERQQSNGPLREVVFFGRLEARKGIIVFCDTIDILQKMAEVEGGDFAEIMAGTTVTFLGKAALTLGAMGDAYVKDRAQMWTYVKSVQALTDRNHQEALKYLRSSTHRRLAVMPSLVENSPYTVLECAELGVSFLVSRVGGVPELLHKSDVERITIPAGDAEAWARRIRQALEEGNVDPARPAIDGDANEDEWIRWHAALHSEQGSPSFDAQYAHSAGWL